MNFTAYNAIGIGPGQSPAQAPVRNYSLTAVPAGGATIAAGGTASVRIKTDGTGPYVVAGLVGTAKLGSLVGASVAGTPLPNTTDPDGAANTMPCMDNVRYEIRVSGNPMNQAPRKLGHLAQSGGEIYRPPVPFVCGPDTEITVTFYNDHASASITPCIEFDGYYDPRTEG